ncbi:hypothetical protein AM629_12225 [Photorhabdus heterorhabditis]|uniref:Transposase n=1 Tax=Photorhabdus heterorhabditis TaxID=880156 RepID=A0ABR5KBD3_9GAMM|nr:hypothetical protein AM629_12225 [Photorhabdus heterorhabditis]
MTGVSECSQQRGNLKDNEYIYIPDYSGDTCFIPIRQKEKKRVLTQIRRIKGQIDAQKASIEDAVYPHRTYLR